ncbi:glutamyl-tRNA(Gln) amidotransferase subunit A, mitochondrial isoform X2 [Anoplophora glabripennis]|uniref:glutamyl-tRNA(Gln) amidotransferase subunit A, mitochondrial isoform X2 n=1 Tax=Anoplophora glabripennis TaxID=217634 RepID=UPI0008750324|nr:glutamyl-tRNA(Gln) amidotransferase subunit A, mitochondrial isoform X2 [Anoplophora glabripennis]
MDKILYSNIKTVSRLLVDGSINTTDLINLSLKKALENQKYNAFITITHSEAIDQSKKSTKRYASKTSLSELDGIPIAIKDNFCTENIKTTCASKMLENFVPTYNATVYQRLLDAGAILIGKTNLDQFAMGSGTVDSLYGPTKNIWKNDDENFHIAGGSSGGSAVATATGTCFAAIGSDTGGSTRNPASYCGIVGLKPTYGLVSRLGLIPLVNSMDVPAGFDPKDSTSLTKPYKKIRLPPANKMSIKGLKIGMPPEYCCDHLSQEVLDIWNDIAQILENDGAIVKKVSMPHTKFSIVCYSILNQCEVASNMARYDGVEYGFRANENSSTEKLYAESRMIGFNEVVRNRILAGNYFLLSRNYDKYFVQALKVRRLICNDFDNVWNDVQILLTPTTLTDAPLYKDFIGKTNRDQCAVQDYCTQPANMAGVPAISIPIKLSKKGLPLSLQLIGRNLSEPMLLALAKYIENIVQFPSFADKLKNNEN